MGRTDNLIRVASKNAMIALALIYSSNVANADPISLVGIDLTMTVEQQQNTLTTSGYQCSEEQHPWGTTYFRCADGKKVVHPSDKKLRYNCDTFNACALSLREFGQAVIDQKIVAELSYEPKYVNDGQTLIEQYCGRGTDGDLLCVIADKNMLGQTLLTLTVEKGTLGSGGVTFE